MITYNLFINNTFQSTIQATSRQQAVALAHNEYTNMAGIHVSKPSQWAIR